MSRLRHPEICFTISEVKDRRRTVLRPVWLNERQLAVLMQCYFSIERGHGTPPWGLDSKTHRELRDKRLVVRLHGGGRCYFAGLTPDGALLARSIDQAAKQEAKKQKRKRKAS